MEALQRRLAVHDRDHGLAVLRLGRAADQDEVAVPDPILDHRVPAHPERVALAGAEERFRHVDELRVLDRLDGLPRGDEPQERNPPARAARRDQGEASLGVERSLRQGAPAPQLGHELRDRVERAEIQMAADLLVGGGVSLPLDEAGDEFVRRELARREHAHGMALVVGVHVRGE